MYSESFEFSATGTGSLLLAPPLLEADRLPPPPPEPDRP